MKNFAKLLTTILSAKPTLAACYLTNQSYVYATLTGNLFTIYPCQPVDSFDVLPTEACTSRIPVIATIANSNDTFYLVRMYYIISTYCQ